jgi:hypothetical protein
VHTLKAFSGFVVIVLASVWGPDALAQNVAVRWSVMDAGAGVLSSGNTRMVSVAGQPLVGVARFPTGIVISGFLADSLFRHNPVSGVEGQDAGVPLTPTLLQNYPNPFNPTTTIGFRIAGAGMQKVSLVLYDILGREVRSLVNDQRLPGTYNVVVDAADLSSGVYFYRLQIRSGEPAGGHDYVDTKKLLILR